MILKSSVLMQKLCNLESNANIMIHKQKIVFRFYDPQYRLPKYLNWFKMSTHF